MKVQHFRTDTLRPPLPTSTLTLWLRSGQQFKGSILSFDLNGLLLLKPNNERAFIIDISEIAVVQFDP